MQLAGGFVGADRQASARAAPGRCPGPSPSASGTRRFRVSPASIARWIGAAPRQRGSSEACTFQQPKRRDVEDRLRQHQAVGDDDHQVGLQRAQGIARRARVFSVSGCSTGRPRCERLELDRRRRAARGRARRGDRAACRRRRLRCAARRRAATARRIPACRRRRCASDIGPCVRPRPGGAPSRASCAPSRA